MRQLSTLTDAVLAAGAGDPASPLLTFYDDATGERTELSTLTATNWAAKCANMIRDEWGLVPGDVVAVDLPVHWQTFVILLGAWWSGCAVTIGPDDDAAAAFCSRDRLDAQGSAGEIAAAGLDAFAMPLPNLPVGVTDFAGAVRVHGDQFTPSTPGPSALGGRKTEDVIVAATASAAREQISPGDRIMSTRKWDSANAVTDNLLAVYIATASLVQVSSADTAGLAARAVSEKVTGTLT
ncbi:TIGR03089 family protein [Williamsia sp. CHRR-6]|uniref:TIGR03089 family protein n=1 Tax=Williamsia sp. CHRR-6 TaxID=2835871 RepID=UPI001BDA0B8B|nr:TIGR03089 family protein [Williamsia sp. CHRR-6]MBT0568477.1 TIGR03089 family protein [Williamsia sp. CHRR-6]